ncbi:MAG: menaquinone biosynthesis decarboxylase [bacterium]
MAYRDLQEFVGELDRRGWLKRVKAPVDCELEITEITDRVSKSRGPALLFENVRGYDIPVLMNAFGSMERMALALGVDDVEDVARDILDFLKPEVPAGLVAKLGLLTKLKRLSALLPREVKRAPCQEVVIKDNPSLYKFPILKCWPLDGGRFITLPLVFTKDPETGNRNVGMYRLQVYDERTTGMHWHSHRVGAKHYRKYEELGRRMDVAVAIGPDPAVTYAATSPMPEEIDELFLAGFLRRKPVEVVRCVTVDQEVPANSQIVLEGYVDPGERRLEGPFGDHTGYYSLPDHYPVFHITCITHRKNPIYPATIVGRPPMEDCYIAKATERIFLPLIKLQLPEIVDINLPIEGIFHNMAIISIDKRYPGHAQKVINAIWGLGQMMFTKIVVVVDGDVNVHDLSEVLWRVGNNIDPQRDIIFSRGPVDVLDHSAPLPSLGSKMGVDATRKWPSEGFAREWPPDIAMDSEIVERVTRRWKEYGIE